MNETTVRALAAEADDLLGHECRTIPKAMLHLPGPDFVDRVLVASDRPPGVLRNLQAIFGHGRLAGTGYVSILPVDQGIEHSAGSAFAPNPAYFDPARIVELAIEGGCNAVASTLGVLGAAARRYAPKIPFIVKVEQAFAMGAAAVGATVYFGSVESDRQIQEVSEAFHRAHALGMATVLWAYLRNAAFKKDQDYELSADLTGQANHLSATIEADIVKQKQPETNGGFKALKFGKTDERVYSELTTDHPIDLTRYQVANCYMGRAGLINSGGGSKGKDDLALAVRTAVINKRAGGMGLITGRKSFQRPMKDGVALLHAVQDVYLDKDVTVA
jgi:class I fructose-bisphosphate aldolase